LRSEAGVGTEVALTLPFEIAAADAVVANPALAALAPPPARRTPPNVAQAERDGQLVLVIDDHPVNRMVLHKQVNALGYAAETARDGFEALAMWRSGRFCLLLTDCNMPGFTGYRLAMEIRAAESAAALPRVPIVACTANAMAGEAQKCFEAGMDDHLVKPVELAKLAAKLAQWMRRGPVDPATLAALSAGDAGVEKVVLESFRQHNAPDCADLRRAIAQRSRPEVLDCCHRIKGAAGTVGAADLAHTCALIEAAAREDRWADVAHPLQALEEELLRIEDFITSRV
jgi:CheY-like chemotaxis protein/HPt (histidine-containing phosphotransfer) domain-containing protein